MSPLPTPSAIPPIMAVRDMLMDMLGRDVKVGPSGPWAPSLRDTGAVAVYVDDVGRVRALISCNLELAVTLGASIALIPAKTAAGILEEGQLTEEIQENLNEVLNILAGLFNPPDGPHVKLQALHAPGQPPPADISAQLRAFGRREDLKIEVAGYGGGRLSLVLV